MGASLIEVVVAIAMIGVILSLTGITIHRLLRVEQVVTQSFVTDRSISRLAIQFRDDVHRSQSATPVESTRDAKSELSLESDTGDRIRYAITERGIARLAEDRTGGRAREDYRLPDCRVSFQHANDSEPRLRSIIIERPSAIATNEPTALRPLRALKIQAYLHQPPSKSVPVIEQDSSATNSDEPQTEEQK